MFLLFFTVFNFNDTNSFLPFLGSNHAVYFVNLFLLLFYLFQDLCQLLSMLFKTVDHFIILLMLFLQSSDLNTVCLWGNKLPIKHNIHKLAQLLMPVILNSLLQFQGFNYLLTYVFWGFDALCFWILLKSITIRIQITRACITAFFTYTLANL